MVVLQKKLRANTPQMAKIETQSKFQLHREVSNESLQAVMYMSLWKTTQVVCIYYHSIKIWTSC